MAEPGHFGLLLACIIPVDVGSEERSLHFRPKQSLSRNPTALTSAVPMTREVLFLDNNHIACILDIPASIEVAQGDKHRLISSLPLDEPYAIPEPKGAKKDIFLRQFPVEHVRYHTELQLRIRDALATVKASPHATTWHVPRVHMRRGKDEDADINAATTALNTQTQTCMDLPLLLSSLPNYFPSNSVVQNQLVCNVATETTGLVLNSACFHVPPSCTFVWSSMRHGLAIMQHLNAHISFQHHAKFDMVLMDPPWANRSVRHARRYTTMGSQASDPFEHALDVAKCCLRANSMVAVWITNKPAVRERVLSALQAMGLALVEEWVWVKITSKGEPVTPLRSFWRHPYEVLLLFQQPNNGVHSLLRRFIFAVPDLHSRKPNLKSLFLQLLNCDKVLELFTRNLTTGWCSIGDETLKFQHDGCWALRDC